MTAYTGWPATLLKVHTSTSEFSRFQNCTNTNNSRNASNIEAE